MGDAKQHFLIELDDGAVFYAPLSEVVLLVEPAVAESIEQFFKLGDWSSVAESTSLPEIVLHLTELGAFDVQKTPTERFAHGPWAPKSLTVSTTQKCTLRCSYCYAEGGRREDLDMPQEMVRDGVELILANALTDGGPARLSFIGEGEATANWEVFSNAIDYFKARCAKLGLRGLVSMSTNGVVSNKRLAYIANNVDSINVSLDGLPAEHDRNRVLPSGRGSFETVVAFIKSLSKHGKSVGIRSSVSNSACEKLPDFVEFIGRELNCHHVHLEPISGIKSFTGVDFEDLVQDRSQRFIDAFRSARRVAAKYQLEVYYSGARTKSTDSFCGASRARMFMITTEGHVTSCNEVLYAKDKRSALFHYGRWKSGQGFEIFDDRIEELSSLSTENITKCQSCFAKFSCAGDCYAKTAATFGQPWDTPYTERCNINRELMKDEILLKLLGQVCSSRAYETQTQRTTC